MFFFSLPLRAGFLWRDDELVRSERASEEGREVEGRERRERDREKNMFVVKCWKRERLNSSAVLRYARMEGEA